VATITLQIFGGFEVNVYICMEMKSLTTSVSYYYNLASSKYIILLVSQLNFQWDDDEVRFVLDQYA
jgi:hypothetical protein